MITVYDNTIYQHLKEHRRLGYSSFHTPGHKCCGFFPEGLLDLDLTELPDTDSLFESSGIILEAERRLAQLFGAGASLISAGGCTLAIQAMLKIASARGKRVILGRNAHRSAVNACALLGIDPVWIMPHSSVPWFTGRVEPDDVEEAFEKHSGISACYITSPDYYGELTDIRAIAKICHRHNALLLVDNAHGSHLAFLERNLHPMALGADMSACSMHKTLPVLTGGAVLNVTDHRLAAECKQAMALFGSTSPSYPIMASVDLCRSYLQKGGIDDYRALEARVDEIKSLARRQGLVVPGGECDPLRVCINTSAAGLQGDRQTEYFHGFLVEPEFCDGNNAVFICTPFNTERDMERLEAAISGLSVPCDGGDLKNGLSKGLILPERAMSPREAVLSDSEMISVECASGRVSAEAPCVCPPGIPIVMPGELIDGNVCQMLEKSGFAEISCVCTG